MSGPTNKRFVRSARMLLAFQFVGAASATGLAIWAATKVQDLVDQRDLLRRRATELEARPASAPRAADESRVREPPAVDNGAASVPTPPSPPPPPPRDLSGRRPPPRTDDTPVVADTAGGPRVTQPPVRRAAEYDPRYANQLQPPYPPSEQRAQREGQVRVRVTITPSGQVSSIVQLMATNDAFWQVTRRQALTRWRFRPATVDGRPVEGTKVMILRFRLVG